MTIFRSTGVPNDMPAYQLKPENLRQLFDATPEDYRVIGPVKEKWAVSLAEVKDVSELAFGANAKEGPGRYRLEPDRRDMDLSRGRPMNSPRSFNLKAVEPVLKATREDGEAHYEEPEIRADKKLFFGLAPCDVAGIHTLDLTFAKQYRDPAYEARRRGTIIVGLNCFHPGANCFCTTFNTGPDLKYGFDLGLSWLDGRYLVEAATETGAELLSEVDKEPAPQELFSLKAEKTALARQAITKSFELEAAVRILDDNYEHPYWDEPSERCLSCANCINVCPTCYCYRVAEQTSVNLKETTKFRCWDACQNLEFAAVHGGNFRPNRVDRIRQWVNHKINWTIEQYGRPGCVGCGRCVTWCPTAIDITEPIWRLGGRDIGISD